MLSGAARHGRASSTAPSTQPAHTASEELAQVASLVERRRMQNRISQRNYRNKIRVRLEKLEALVHAQQKEEDQDQSQNSTESTEVWMSPPEISVSQSTPRKSKVSDGQRNGLNVVAESCRICGNKIDFFYLGSDTSDICHCSDFSMHFGETEDAKPLFPDRSPPELIHASTVENSPATSTIGFSRLNDPLMSLRSIPPSSLQVPVEHGSVNFPSGIQMGAPLLPMGMYALPSPPMEATTSLKPWTDNVQGSKSSPPHPTMSQNLIWVPVSVTYTPLSTWQQRHHSQQDGQSHSTCPTSLSQQ